MGASLQRQRFRAGGFLEQTRHRRVGNHAVQRAAAMEGIEADRRTAAEGYVATAAHIRSIRGQYEIELDRDIGLQDLRRRQGAAQVELLLYREHEMQIRQALYLLERTGELEDRGTSRPVVDRSAGQAVVRQGDDLGPVDHRGADADAGGLDRVRRGEADIDVEFGIGDDAVFFLRRGRVMALVGEHPRQVPALAHAQQYGLRGQRPLGDPAQPFDPQETIGFNLADHETKLIHVGEQHHARRPRIALDRGDQVAQPVAARCDAEIVEPRTEIASDPILVTTQSGDHHQFRERVAQPLFHAKSPPHAFTPVYKPIIVWPEADCPIIVFQDKGSIVWP